MTLVFTVVHPLLVQECFLSLTPWTSHEFCELLIDTPRYFLFLTTLCYSQTQVSQSRWDFTCWTSVPHGTSAITVSTLTSSLASVGMRLQRAQHLDKPAFQQQRPTSRKMTDPCLPNLMSASNWWNIIFRRTLAPRILIFPGSKEFEATRWMDTLTMVDAYPGTPHSWQKRQS